MTNIVNYHLTHAELTAEVLRLRAELAKCRAELAGARVPRRAFARVQAELARVRGERDRLADDLAADYTDGIDAVLEIMTDSRRFPGRQIAAALAEHDRRAGELPEVER
jgi:ribosomal protein L29